MVPDAAVKHYEQMQRLQALVVLAGAQLWSEVSLTDLSGSWAAQVPLLVPVLSGVQVKAASAGASYGAATLAEQSLYEAPQHFVNPKGFSGIASDGRSLEGALYSAVPYVKNLIGGGMAPAQALKSGGSFLTTITRTQVADAGRGAAGVDTVTRNRVSYVRMLNPPSCSRCSILAGRVYRWNAGFRRHNRCDCIHVMTTARAAAETEGLIHDPYEYFKSLSPEDQDKNYTKAGAQAIRDGSDIFQVVNSRRGMKPGGLMTTEGTTKRGNFRATAGDSTRGRRLTPEAIYKLNGDNRAGALKDLEKYGYILPGGQNPLGSITGQREGFGALGHGGAHPAARKRVEDAITNGRDPAVRATMTESERRLFDAKARWELVQQGVNPYGAPSMTPRAKINTSPLTPQISAQVEKDYRRWVATGGQVFK
ncbi:hypothetical protein NIBR502772_06065 [Pseudarthrobacter sp. NIBRBAC000502772]|uniref:hypothetical protein n=1 Tax=Pseudarthrobacter sp. NIBRBAC000502772 TaxID=2590775 RepID=UPI001131974D|nr:hypothetical protein [Pseudarthrobacter sp. NIBRBAC000502772]QDG65837.1 hypothetical protein NIBR502772_06065 [Pseudarthrobacter sp. NIBRBAC000502772]